MASVDSGAPGGCRVYLITPPKLDPVSFADLLAAALDADDVAAVQLRLKDVGDDIWRRAIDALRPVTQSRGVAFLLNDRADLVKATGCDGAHVGQDDMPARSGLGDAGWRRRRRLRGVRRVLSVDDQGCDQSAGSRDPAVVVGDDGTAQLRHRRDYGGELRAAGAGRDGFPGRGRMCLEPSGWAGRRVEGTKRGDPGSRSLMLQGYWRRPSVLVVTKTRDHTLRSFRQT